MKKFKSLMWIGLSIVLLPVSFVVIALVLYGVHAVSESRSTHIDKPVETHIDTVKVHKVVVDTVKIKVYEKVSAPKVETPKDSL